MGIGEIVEAALLIIVAGCFAGTIGIVSAGFLMGGVGYDESGWWWVAAFILLGAGIGLGYVYDWIYGFD